MSTHPWSRIKCTTWLCILLVAAIAFAIIVDHTDIVALHNVQAATPIDAPNLMEGIDLAGQANDTDVAYVRDGLNFLRDYVPEWYDYIQQAKPFVLSIGQVEGKDWVAAQASCCDAEGKGRITFDDHLGVLTASSGPEDHTPPARQVMFLSALIHEATHVREYRAGRIPLKIDAVTCISAERMAYAAEIEFKRALVSATFAGDKSAVNHRTAAQRQLDVEESLFDSEFWKIYCIFAYPNVMDD